MSLKKEIAKSNDLIAPNYSGIPEGLITFGISVCYQHTVGNFGGPDTADYGTQSRYSKAPGEVNLRADNFTAHHVRESAKGLGNLKMGKIEVMITIVLALER